MWAAFCYGNFTPYPFGNFAPFPLGNFNGMAPVNYMGFPPTNMFPVPFGCVYPAPACIPYAMAPGIPPVLPCNYNAGHYQNYRVHPPVPPCNFDAGHYQNFKGDYPQSLNTSSTRKVKAVSPAPCNSNDGHPRNYKDRPRNVNAAFQRPSRPSVSEFSENPKQYQGFVLVMVISTGKMEVLNWREASEKGKQVKIVSSTRSELRCHNTRFFRS